MTTASIAVTAPLHCDFCEEHVETSAKEPLECSICAGRGPSNDKLCTYCHKYSDVYHILYCDDPGWPDIEQDTLRAHTGLSQGLPPWESIPKQPAAGLLVPRACMLCTLVAEMIQDNAQDCDYGAEVSYWRPFPTYETIDHWIAQEKADEGHFVLPVFLWMHKEDTEPLVFFLELTMQYSERHLEYASPWDRSLIDTAPIQKWLTACTSQVDDHKSLHSKCSDLLMPLELPGAFRLIDIPSRCLVAYSEIAGGDKPQYVTLSYTWASMSNLATRLTRDNLSMLSSPGALEQRNLFADVMALCHNLGQRYLWIDRLCVVQDDPADLATQIHAMDAIYHGAILTIVTLTEGSAGLPGTSIANPRPQHWAASGSSTRKPCWQLEPTNWFKDGAGRAFPPFLEIVAESSRWDSRGWTYQEKRMSRRILFATDHHVYLCCPGLMSGNGNTTARRNHRVRAGGAYLTAGSHFERSMGLGRSLDPFAFYADAVEDFSKRELTFWSDKLKAFAGFGNVLARRLGTDSLIFGMPGRFLSRSLLWSALQPSDRKEVDRVWAPAALDIPSWSWASWKGGVSYAQREAARPQDVGNLVKFWWYHSPAASPEGELYLESVVEAKFWFDETALDSMSQSEEISHYTSILQRHQRSSLNSWRASVHGPWEALNYKDVASAPEHILALAKNTPGALVFNTTSAELRLSTRPAMDPNTHSVPVQVNILGPNDSVVGCVQPIMPDKETALKAYEGLNSEDYCFTVIVIAASLYCPGFGGEYGLPHATDSGLFVLVTKREESGVLRRVAVGIVALSEWNGTSAKWETVVLA